MIILSIHTICHTLHRKQSFLSVCLLCQCRKKSFITIFFYYASFFFDWKTPVGYITAIAMQSVAIVLSVNIYVGLLFLYFGVCLFSVTFTTDITLNLHASNKKLKINRSRNGKLEFKKKLNEIWQFHSDARRLNLSHIFLFLLNLFWIHFIFFQICSRLFQRFQQCNYFVLFIWNDHHLLYVAVDTCGKLKSWIGLGTRNKDLRKI